MHPLAIDASDGTTNFGAKPRLDETFGLEVHVVGKREIIRDPSILITVPSFFFCLALSHGSGFGCLFFGGLDQNEDEEFEGMRRERGAGKSAG